VHSGRERLNHLNIKNPRRHPCGNVDVLQTDTAKDRKAELEAVVYCLSGMDSSVGHL